MPKVSRYKITIITGLIATLAGAFPAIAMKLLDFVALYGLILMPMGAVIFVDFWLIRKFGLKSYYAKASGRSFNWAAGLAWFVTLSVCTILTQMGSITTWLAKYNLISAMTKDWLVDHCSVQIFFVSLPGWFIAAALYIVVSKVYQKTVRPNLG